MSILLFLLFVSASFSRNTTDFPCIFGVGKFYLFLFFFFSCQIAFSALYTVNLFLSYVTSSLYLTFVYSLNYKNIFLPIKNMRNNLKLYANMKLLTYRSLFFFYLKYTLQKCNRLYYKFKR